MSELNVVMTAGFATIAGSVMGAYILFGVITQKISLRLFVSNRNIKTL
jgi:nucleoside permease NupC